MLHSIEQSDRTSQLSFPNGTLERQSTGCTTTLRTQRSAPTVALIRDVLFRPVVSLRPLILSSVSCWQTSAGCMTQVPSSLPNWTTGTVNLELQPSRVHVWRASCRDPIPHELHDKVKPTLGCLRGHLQIRGDIESRPIVLGEQASMEQTKQRFQRIATTLADLNAQGLNTQTVNDLLSMCDGAASQHVLSMSFVQNKKPRPLTLRSLLSGHNASNATPPPRCSFYSQAWRSWCWHRRAATCCSTMTCLAIGHSKNHGNHSIPRHRHPFQRTTTTASPTCSTSNHTLTTDEQASLPPQTTWRCPTPKRHPEKTCLFNPTTLPQTAS